MKKVFTALWVLLLLLGTFKEAAIYISFKLNQNYIAQNLCVEKDIENSTCNGCCQLKEKINETRTQEHKQIPEKLQEQNQPLLFLSNKLKPCFSSFITKDLSKKPAHIHNYSFLFFNDIFHPPKG